MEPFDHYSTGLDFTFFSHHQDVYEELVKRAELLIDNEKKKFLGQFSEIPRQSFKELTEKIEALSVRISRLRELNAPPIIIEGDTHHKNDLEEQLKNKDFISFNDKDAIEYKKAHDALTLAFYHSPEYKTILEEIRKYNDEKFADLYGMSPEDY